MPRLISCAALPLLCLSLLAARSVPAATEEDAPGPLERATQLQEAGRTEEAIEILEPLAEGDDHRALVLLGTILYEAEDYERAVELLERAVELAPERADYRLSLGAAYLERLGEVGRLRKLFVAGHAREAFEKAVELDPGSIEARWALLTYYAEAPGMAGGGMDKARAQAEALREIDPAQGNMALGNLSLREEDLESAERSFRAALEAEPENLGIRMSLGFLYQRMESWDAAYDAFEAVLDAEPRHPMALYQVGRTGALSGRRLERAAAALRTYLELEPGEGEPTHAHAHWRLGNVSERAGDLAEARRQYRRALEIDPELEQARDALRALD